MKKTWVTIFLVLAIIATAAFWLLIREKMAKVEPSKFGNAISEIKINGEKFSTEIVSTSEKMALGLSGRESLCQNCAMLFIFKKAGEHSFWMKDMQFDLDIIWISGDEIANISKNVSHMRGSVEIVRSDVPIDKVLEVNAGMSDRLNLKMGDKMEF